MISKALAFILVLLITACTAEKSATEYLEDARTHLAEGKLQAALIEARNSARIAPENSASRAFLGEIELLTGYPTNSEKEISKAIELGAPATSLTHLLSRAHLLQGKHEELMSLEIGALSASNAAEVLANQASSNMLLSDKLAATALAQQALDLDPDSPTVLTINARLQAVENEIPTARDFLTRALSSSDTHADAWELLGDIETSEQNLEEAESAYSNAIDNTPFKLPVLLKRARLNLSLKDFAKVETDLDAISGAGAKIPAVALMKTEILFSEANFLQAQIELEEALRLYPDSPPLTRSLALTNLMLGNLGQAEQFAKQYLGASSSGDAMVLLAAIRLQQGRLTQSEQTLQPILEANQLDGIGFRILATTYLKQDKLDEAITIMTEFHTRITEAGVTTLPDLALLDKPSAVLSEEILETSSVASEEFGDDYLSKENLSIVKALTFLLQEQFDEANVEVDKLIELSPQHPAINQLQGRILIATNSLEEAKESFEKSYASQKSASSAMYLALLDIHDDNVDLAKTRLTDALEKSEGMMRERLFLALARMDSSSGDAESMSNWLEQAKSDNSQAYSPSIALASYYFQTGDTERVFETISSLSPMGRSNPQSIKLIAQAHIALKQFEEARDFLTESVSKAPDDPEWRYLRAGAFAGLGDTASVISDLDAALRANPDHAPSLIAKTKLDIQSDRLEVAAQQLAKLENIVPGTPGLSEMYDQLNAQINKNASPNSAVTADTTEKVLEAAKALWTDNKQDEALSLMNGWTVQNPEDTVVLLTLANTYAALGRQDDSVRTFNAILDIEPSNFMALNNLAWQLREEDPSAAIRYVQSALELQPDNIPTLDTLAVIHYGQGNYSEAEQAFRKIQTLGPTDPTVLFHGAEIELALGNKQAAKELLEQIISDSQSAPVADDAKALLEKL